MSLKVKNYLDRDDEFKITFYKNDEVVGEGVITKVELNFSSIAFDGEQSDVVDTNGPMVTFVESNQAVVVNLQGLNLKSGTHLCRVTVWDVTSQEGIPWGEFSVETSQWDFT